ncbi:MAG: glucosaminidase domain-containing protein [Saprospiraceae bacterium]|nr:MAG: mannosyl-glycoprotein endo-beta-N-acetylglucosamidase [Bacteroidetes bacterium OLB9]MCO6464276.1 glucosaminidase domain-containing protein [Saprospiraceae bacterium]MCZ2337848.1 glucosaminidase domain-containing protein [Chitinophagales bacterium]
MISKNKIVVLILMPVILMSFTSIGNKKLTEDYISAYKNIAISEMYRTGIPASIKMAQAMLESDIGRSPLAVQANNHFGIKCGGNWDGATYFQLDDDRGNDGTLVESCFRSFSSPEASFIAHSDFLTDPAKKSRYGFLFELSSTDYEGWANGLKFAGYATDPTYPSKLIKIIEKYKLYELDDAPNNGVYADNTQQEETPKTNPSVKDEPMLVNDNYDESPSHKDKYNRRNKTSIRISRINGLKVVVANGGETLAQIASKYGIRAFELQEYNENITGPDYVLGVGEKVYLEKKKKNIEGEAQFHVVKKGETMYSIAQAYGIRLESLLAKNNLPEDAMPLTGEQISLVKHLSQKQTPRYKLVERFDAYVDLGALR